MIALRISTICFSPPFSCLSLSCMLLTLCKWPIVLPSTTLILGNPCEHDRKIFSPLAIIHISIPAHNNNLNIFPPTLMLKPRDRTERHYSHTFQLWHLTHECSNLQSQRWRGCKSESVPGLKGLGDLIQVTCICMQHVMRATERNSHSWSPYT